MTGLIRTEDPTAPRELMARGLDALPATAGETFGAMFADQMTRNPLPSALRLGRLGSYQPTEDDIPWGLAIREENTEPILSAEAANEEFGIAGHLKFDAATPEPVARELYTLKRDELDRAAVLARSEGAGGVAAQLAGGLAAGLLDPLNIASAFIPLVGPTRYAAMLAGAGGAMGRTAVRAGVGAAEGVAGAALLEPIVYAAAVQEQADYGAADSLLNIAFGGIMGGGLHSVGGAIGDAMNPGRWKSPVASAADAAPITRKEDALRASIAAVADGETPPDGVALALRERAALGNAYDAVRAAPSGPADDPLVTIEPADIEKVIVARGGYKGLGDVEVKGQGWGLVKFIWRHGEESLKAAENQIIKDDLLAFPEVIRSRQAEELPRSDGGAVREWRAMLPGADGQPRMVVFADNQIDGKADRRLVTVYVQEAGKTGADKPESPRLATGTPRPPGQEVEISSREAQDHFARPVSRGEPAKTSIGRRGAQSNLAAVFDGANRRVNVRYEVRELGDLTVSTTDDFRVNPAYPAELQPRDRARSAAQAQIGDIVARFEPAKLTRSPDAATGAPVVGPDGVVESGNGRSMALRRIYAAHPQKATAYQAELVRQGFSVTGFQQPVLVARRLDDMDAATRKAFSEDAQRAPTMTFSASERAAMDAGRMDADTLALHKGGDVGLARNADFVRGFIGKLPQAEQGALTTADGKLSLDGRRRIDDALTARAYDDVDTLAPMLETPDDGNRALGAALREAAPRWAAMRDAEAAGLIAPGRDATNDLLEAVKLVRDAVAAERPLNRILSQFDMFNRPGAATEWFVSALVSGERMASKERISAYLNGYIDEAMATRPGADMLGDMAEPAEQVLRRLAGKQGVKPQWNADGEAAAKAMDAVLARAEEEGKPNAVKLSADDEGVIDAELTHFARVIGEQIDNESKALLKSFDDAAEADGRAMDAAAFCLSRKG